MIGRRNLMKWSAGTALLSRYRPVMAGEHTMQERVASIISEYDAQGIHRTGTLADHQSAAWLAGRIEALGVRPDIDTFAFKRIDVRSARLLLGDHVIDGVPLYDCGYTDASGVSGAVGELGSDADIAIAQLSAAAEGIAKLTAARQRMSHKAIVIVTDSRMPTDGIATINAENFRVPFGPPVLQVASADWPAMAAAIKSGAQATVIAHCQYVAATASNIQATITGNNTALAPVVVMTPRSGWWHCASERGGGIAAFLEIMRAIKTEAADRTVIFTANTGHELGHTGLDHYLDANRALIRDAHVWIHLGANFAARVGAGVRLQYASDALKAQVEPYTRQFDVQPASNTAVGTRPLGEARNVYDGGGRYVSILGSNGLFHHPADRYPQAVDVPVTTRWVNAFASLAADLARA